LPSSGLARQVPDHGLDDGAAATRYRDAAMILEASQTLTTSANLASPTEAMDYPLWTVCQRVCQRNAVAARQSGQR